MYYIRRYTDGAYLKAYVDKRSMSIWAGMPSPCYSSHHCSSTANVEVGNNFDVALDNLKKAVPGLIQRVRALVERDKCQMKQIEATLALLKLVPEVPEKKD